MLASLVAPLPLICNIASVAGNGILDPPLHPLAVPVYVPDLVICNSFALVSYQAPSLAREKGKILGACSTT